MPTLTTWLVVAVRVQAPVPVVIPYHANELRTVLKRYGFAGCVVQEGGHPVPEPDIEAVVVLLLASTKTTMM